VGIDRLQNHFVRDEVTDHSRFFDPEEMGRISDFEQHHVSCDPTGSFGFFHSDPFKLRTVRSWKALVPEAESKRVDMTYTKQLYTQLTECVKSVLEATPLVPDKVQEMGTVMMASYVLRRYFNLEWLILP
jgi:hypothetical protein